MTNYQLFIDLDGVCADFDYHVVNLLKLKDIPSDLPLGLYPWIPEGSSIRRELNNLMKDYYFWRDMPPLPWAHEIIHIARNYGEVFFLSKGMQNAGCFGGKMDWVKFHFPSLADNLILTSRHKWVCSKKGGILIDDDLRHKKEWENMGGTFYHWRNIRGTNEGAELIKKELDKLDNFLDNATLKDSRKNMSANLLTSYD